MSLLSELGTGVKEQIDSAKTLLATTKSQLETAIGQKLDNVEFKTINGNEITGNGNIDLTQLTNAGGTILKEHSGGFSSLKLDWSDLSKKYSIIKVFTYINDNSSCCGGYGCIRIKVGDCWFKDYYCGGATRSAYRGDMSNCYFAKGGTNAFRPFGDSVAHMPCGGSWTNETTFFKNGCYCTNMFSMTSYQCGREGANGGGLICTSQTHQCSCMCPITGLCFNGGTWRSGVKIIVIGYGGH